MFLRQNNTKNLRIPLSGIPVKTGIHWAIPSWIPAFAGMLILIFSITPALAATTIPFTINMSEPVNVTGTPRIPIDVGGNVDGTQHYATYASGTGTSTLTFNYAMIAGDVDLDGVTLTSPIDLNGGTIKDLNGNDATLTFTVPNTSNVKVNYPSLGMDFTADADGRFTLNGTPYNDLTSFLTASGGTFTRASVGTYFDSSGVMQTAASGAPRFDYDPVTHAAKGILIEEARTNYITNAQFSGAAVNVAPTGIIMGPYPGITASVSGVGAINGQNYIDVTFSGTNPGPGTAYPGVFFASNIAASVGQSWTARINIINVSGTSSSTPYFELGELNTSGNFLTASYTAATTNGYKTLSRTLSSASVAKIRFILVTGLASGGSINQTFRLAVPQLERGSSATSYIPTTSAATTRAAENFIIPTGAWYNNSSVGTLSVEAFPNSLVSGGGMASFQMSSDPSASYISPIKGSTSTIRIRMKETNNGLQINASLPSNISSLNKMGISYGGTTFGAVNGTLTSSSTGLTIPVIDELRLGAYANNVYSNGWIQKFKYYPNIVSSTQLQLLTQ